MYIDTNSLPEDYDAQKWIDQHKAIVVNDPTKIVNPLPTQVTTTTCNGFWDQITTTPNLHPFNGSLEDPLEKRLKLIEEEMAIVRTELKLSRLKILALEGKFTQEEVANIRKMIMSKDEASITLADTIIDNA